jgi:ubiquinone/menaquinone biosynthesis C-methylase UbiE
MSIESESYFAQVAATYDRLQPLMVGPSYELGLQMMLDLLPFEREDAFTFVDLGSGTAEFAARALGLYPQAHAVCIDHEPAMLAIARQKLATFGARAEVVQADFQESHLPACDVALSAKVFHHLAPGALEQLLQQVAHALRPGGCLIVFDHMAAGPEWGERTTRRLRRIKQQYIADCVKAGKATQAELDARQALKQTMQAEGTEVEYLRSADEICALMRLAGFEEASIVWRWAADTILVGYKA